MDRAHQSHLYQTIIRISFFLLFCLIPFLLTPWNYELFEYNKMMGVYLLTTIITAAWLMKSFVERKFAIARTPLDIPIGLFVVSQLVSALFSIDPHISWFGYYSRFNGGMVSVISYAILFYAFVTHFTDDGNSKLQEPNLKQISITKKHKKNKKYIAESSQIPAISTQQGNNGTMQQWPVINRLLSLTILSGVIISLYGVAERMGIDKHLWVQDVQSRVFSSLGQPNWLAAYLVALMPIAMAFIIIKTQRLENHGDSQSITENRKFRFKFRISNFEFSIPTIYYLLTAGLFFFVLLSTRSRSGFFAFAAADLLFWAATLYTYLRNAVPIRPLKIPFLIVHATFAMIIFFNGSYIDTIDKYFTLDAWVQSTRNLSASSRQGKKQETITQTKPAPSAPTGPLLESGGTESGTIRKFVWQAALDGWKATPKNMLIGTGTETFAFAFYQYKPVGHNLTSEWDFLYNKAHNEYLNYLTTTGLFGLVSYIVLLIAMGVVFVTSHIPSFKSQTDSNTKNLNTQTINPKNIKYDSNGTRQQWNNELTILLPALFAGWVSVLITNFFGFSVVIVQLFLFLFPAVSYVLLQKNHRRVTVTIPPVFAIIASIIVACVCAFTIYRIGLSWVADKTFAAGYRLNRVGSPAKAYPYMTQAISMIPDEPLYRDERASLLSTLSLSAIDSGQATLAAQLAQQAVTDNQTSLMISPNNVNYWKTRTKVLYAMTPIDPGYLESAITSLEHAVSLSPNDPKIVYNLGVLAARAGKSADAEMYLLRAKALKQNYRDVYKGLYLLYTQLKNPAKAREVLTWYLNSVNPNDEEFLGLLREVK